jgi:hypothetical protein
MKDKDESNKEGGKLAPLSIDGIQFENDFGESPIGLAHFSKDQGLIAVASLVGAFVGAAVAGLPLAVIILIAGLNDIRFASSQEEPEPTAEPKVIEQHPEPDAIEVPAQVVEQERVPSPIDHKPAETTPSPAPIVHSTTSSTSAPTANTAPSSTKWINNFVSQTGLIWGNQGSGKSWMARYVAKLKKDKGYRVVVLDPDSNRAEWQGVESYHDFEEIAEFLNWYVKELMARYKAFNASNMI